MRTVSVGKPSAEVETIAAVVIDGLNAAIATIRPGVTAGEVDAACRGEFIKAGIDQHFPHRTGYSIGIAFPPDWGEGHIMSLKSDDPTILQPNMTFHMPPGALVYGKYGIGFSETVRVTHNGCEVLTKFPRDLHVVG
jgi:Xaa-Pro dipeptidase